MGVVYKALDPTIGRTVAIKSMRLDLHGADQQEILQRFQQEARAAGLMHHTNIVTVHDAGEQDGVFFIVMEYVEGKTLQQVLAERGRLPLKEVLTLSRQICSGLDYAHSHSVVHRDVKPANVAITPDGTPKIMDFGIAKAGGGMTTYGHILGTPYYMSPEQVRGQRLDGRSDLFSFGIILYQLVTGQKPFTAEDPHGITYHIVNVDPTAPHELDADIPRDLSAVLLQALNKDRDRRYQTGAALVSALANCQVFGGLKEAAPPGTTPTVRRERTGQAAEIVASSPGAARSVRRPAARLRIGILMAVLGVLALYGYRVRTTESPSAGVQPQSRPAAARVGSAPATRTNGPAAASSSPTPALEIPAKRAEPKPATITVQSIPPGAAVVLDGAVTDKVTPTELTVPPGDHTVLVRLQGYQEASITTTLAEGEPFTFAASLRPQGGGVGGFFRKVFGSAPQGQGTLEVKTNPKGATILVDGRQQEKTTPAELRLDPGSHVVVLQLEGYASERATVQIEPGKKVKLDESLKSSTEAEPK